MSSSTAAAAATAAASKEGHGVLVPASKIHTSFKTELLNTLASPEFTSGQVKDSKPGREPKLVGILATKKEDARAYAEVGTRVEEFGMRLAHGVDKWTRARVFLLFFADLGLSVNGAPTVHPPIMRTARHPVRAPTRW
jgi:hypothetical protein